MDHKRDLVRGDRGPSCTACWCLSRTAPRLFVLFSRYIRRGVDTTVRLGTVRSQRGRAVRAARSKRGAFHRHPQIGAKGAARKPPCPHSEVLGSGVAPFTPHARKHMNMSCAQSRLPFSYPARARARQHGRVMRGRHQTRRRNEARTAAEHQKNGFHGRARVHRGRIKSGQWVCTWRRSRCRAGAAVQTRCAVKPAPIKQNQGTRPPFSRRPRVGALGAARTRRRRTRSTAPPRSAAPA